jgi:hypothetical protein
MMWSSREARYEPAASDLRTNVARPAAARRAPGLPTAPARVTADREGHHPRPERQPAHRSSAGDVEKLQANTRLSREGSSAQAGRHGSTELCRLRSQQIYEVVHVDEQTDRLLIILPASGADATHAGHFCPEWAPQHNFSTSCPFMVRPLPTKCIVALPREASNKRMCRC